MNFASKKERKRFFGDDIFNAQSYGWRGCYHDCAEDWSEYESSSYEEYEEEAYEGRKDACSRCPEWEVCEQCGESFDVPEELRPVWECRNCAHHYDQSVDICPNPDCSHDAFFAGVTRRPQRKVAK